MSTSVALEGRDLALQIHDALSELDRSRRATFPVLRARLSTQRTKLASLAQDARQVNDGGLAEAADELLTGLEEIPDEDARRAWLAFRKEVQPSYERLASALREEDVLVPSLRPTNYARNVLHVASAASGILALELLPSWGATVALAASFAIAGWTLEITRRHSEAVNRFCLTLFGPTAHPHERERINSATWYTTALVLIALTGVIPAAVVALAVLGAGDPLAAIVGRRFGRIKLLHGRTLEGTLAFVVAGAVASGALLFLVHPALGLGPIAAMCLAGAAAGAVTEAVSRRVDDNLTIPLAAFAGAWLVSLLFV
jgi:dolichol kinase